MKRKRKKISLEETRLELQDHLDIQKSQSERNRLGQFATPTALAVDVLRHAKELLPASEPVRFLDPAFGTGSFYSALLATFPKRRVSAAHGLELDPHYARPARQLWADHPLKLQLADFTAADPPAKKFNLLICNPPYVRHHHLKVDDKQRLHAAAYQASGVSIAGLSGLYCYFLAISHRWLASDAIAGWLVPSEFMDVNYGTPIKRYLLSQVELLRIHRFDPTDLQFDDALVSSAIVWYRNRKPRAGHTVDFTYGGSLEQPRQKRSIAAADLRKEAKWSRFPAADVRVASNSPKLSDFFKIQRGLATGDNSFFILTAEEIRKRALPMDQFVPILPSPRYLAADEIASDTRGLPQIDQQLFLLNCKLAEADVRKLHPKLWDYLQSGNPEVSSRYLCRHRAPWYAQENRAPAQFLCTYMGRGAAKNERPFRFILNHSKATAANVYLLLYPKPPLQAVLRKKPALARKIWLFLNSLSSQTLLGEGRVYGGGLYKMEPKELANVPAEQIARLIEAFVPPVPRQISLFEGLTHA